MQNPEQWKDELRAYAQAQGIDMVGFAHIDRFANAPEEFHPRNIYPHAKTVVVLGIRVLRGLMESLDEGLHIPYNAHGYGGINEQFMRDARQRVACWIEDRGFAAVPVIQWTGTPHQEPIMCHRTAAVAAGLGEFGWSKVFLSKRFGPLQRFGIVLTDAELPSDPLQLDQVCDGCKACVRGCPGEAISADTAVEYDIDGQTIRHAVVDMFKCTVAHHGAIDATYPRKPVEFDIADIDARYAAMRQPDDDDTRSYTLGGKQRDEVWQRYPHPIANLVGMLGHSCAFCGAKGCFRACLAHLEKRGLLEPSPARPYEGKRASTEAVPATRAAEGGEVMTE
jgi:epoxyqueuosine reductase